MRASPTFTLTFLGQTTASLAWNAPLSGGAGSVQAELQNLSAIGAGNVAVTGTPGSSYTITFTGALANRDMPTITVSNTGTNYGTSATETTVGGGLLLSGGILAIPSAGALGTGGLSLVRNGPATLRATNPVQIANFVDLSTSTASTLTIGGNQNVEFTNTITQTATTTIAITNTAATTFSGTAASNNALNLGNSTLTVTPSANANATVTGIVSSTAAAGALTKAGTGTLVLTNSNTYAGTTTVSAGVLNVRNSASLGTTTNTIQQFGVTSTGGGSFTITFNSQVTASLSYSGTTPPTALASISTVQVSTNTHQGLPDSPINRI